MAPCFVADCMVGRLAKWLRAFGFDVTYHPFAEDAQLLAWAREKDAILITRDTLLARRKGVRIIFVRDDHLEQQLRQVAEEAPLDLSQARPLSRCMVCNHLLEPIPKEAVRSRVPPYVYATQETFVRCPSCQRIYWRGTHAGKIQERLARLLGQAG